MDGRRGAVVLLTVAMLLTGCSDPDDPSADPSGVPRTTATPLDPETQAGLHEYVDALAEGLIAQEAPMDERQARCFSDGLIDVVGLERVQGLGAPADAVERTRGLDFSALEITRKQGDAIFDQLEECEVDVRRSTLADVSQGATKRQQRCLARAVTGDRVREYYVTLMVQGPPDDDGDGDGAGDGDGGGDGSKERDRKKDRDKGADGKKDRDRDKTGDRDQNKDKDKDKDRDRAERPRDPGDSPLMRAMVKCLR